MKKVFIGGSRRISRLNKDIKSKLDQVIRKGYTVLIGDANGTDKAVQSYLASKNYANVLVFCMADRCRNNIGDWRTRGIEVSHNNRDFYYYATKDLEMEKEADYGFMIWDAKSKGTLNNIVNLLKEGKKTLIYFSPEKSFYTLDTFVDLVEILAKCDPKSVEELKEKLGLSQLLPLPDSLVESTQLRLQLVAKDTEYHGH
ncbi:MAG: hypothetical protein Q8O05_03120 [Chloroflexota bacterium]|nr:hypothetical protein [Chloroflexota bacterium]